MNQKKILFLGGSYSQLPAIKYAKEQGHYVITADYLPENPGHKLADEYYNISTTNINGILNLSENLKINAICAYASDPAAPTAAYVSEKLKLVGNSFQSVQVLSNKNLFRNFLKENKFITPWFFSSSEYSQIEKNYAGEKAILKPVDSSGSKGVFLINNKLDLINCFYKAKEQSRTGTVIIEQYINRKGPQIHGEGFIFNGEIVFILLGDQSFSYVNPIVPYSTIVPSIFHADIMDELVGLVNKVIKKVGFTTGGVNIEMIRDTNDNIYLLEIGARNGGNFMPQLMYYATGFDLVKANVDSLINPLLSFQSPSIPKNHYAQIILHSKKKGIFKGLNIPSEFKNCLLDKYIYYKKGDLINEYNSSKDVIGVLIFELDDNNLENYYKHLEANNWIETK